MPLYNVARNLQRQATNDSRFGGIECKCENLLDFANDLALLGRSYHSKKLMASNPKVCAEKVGLRISGTKTKIQKFGCLTE